MRTHLEHDTVLLNNVLLKPQSLPITNVTVNHVISSEYLVKITSVSSLPDVNSALATYSIDPVDPGHSPRIVSIDPNHSPRILSEKDESAVLPSAKKSDVNTLLITRF